MPSATLFNPSIHLAEGDVSIDNTHFPTTLQLRLKKLKTDQLGNGVDAYVGRTNFQLCPFRTGLDYMVARCSDPGPFFRFLMDPHSSLHNKCMKYSKHWASPIQSLLDTDLE